MLCRLAALLTFAATLVSAQTVMPIWPDKTGPSPNEKDTTTDKSELIAGRRVQRITGVTNPTMAVYPADASHNSGAAIVVFPGGGYRILAYDLEGTEVCDWLHTIGVTCVLLKYRVPDAGPFPQHTEDLADAQRTVRLTREHAQEWKIDPARVGVLGFSAGGHLAAVLSNHPDQQTYAAMDAADKLSARPDFAVVIYPGYLVRPPNLLQIAPEVMPTAHTPPTFLVQAEDDPVHVENASVYFESLKSVGVPAEIHLYAQGRHGYGLRRTELPITKWPVLAEEWLHTIKVLN